MSMFETSGRNDPDYLVEDPNGIGKIAIPCEPGNGTVKRGTVMYRKESGMWAPAAAESAVDTNQLAVLDETVDTDANATVAEDAAAYSAGRFITGRVFLANDAPLTEAIKVVLRKQNIEFKPMMGADTFNNVKA